MSVMSQLSGGLAWVQVTDRELGLSGTVLTVVSVGGSSCSVRKIDSVCYIISLLYKTATLGRPMI